MHTTYSSHVHHHLVLACHVDAAWAFDSAPPKKPPLARLKFGFLLPKRIERDHTTEPLELGPEVPLMVFSAGVKPSGGLIGGRRSSTIAVSKDPFSRGDLVVASDGSLYIWVAAIDIVSGLPGACTIPHEMKADLPPNVSMILTLIETAGTDFQVLLWRGGRALTVEVSTLAPLAAREVPRLGPHPTLMHAQATSSLRTVKQSQDAGNAKVTSESKSDLIKEWNGAMYDVLYDLYMCIQVCMAHSIHALGTCLGHACRG